MRRLRLRQLLRRGLAAHQLVVALLQRVLKPPDRVLPLGDALLLLLQRAMHRTEPIDVVLVLLMRACDQIRCSV